MPTTDADRRFKRYDMNKQEIKKEFEKYSIVLTEEKQEMFLIFLNTLKEYNEKFNITSIKEDNQIIEKHFIDSLMGEKCFLNGASVVEIGSGGGFPSIPLKIMREDLSFTLVESTGKKCTFLNEVKKRLGFKNFEVLNARCEDLSVKKEYRENFTHATARAVARLNTLCEYCLPFVKVGGSFLPYKSDDEEEFKEAKKAIDLLGGSFNKKITYSIQGSMDKRCVYEIDKIKNTPDKYPRRNGKERSKPII